MATNSQGMITYKASFKIDILSPSHTKLTNNNNKGKISFIIPCRICLNNEYLHFIPSR